MDLATRWHTPRMERLPEHAWQQTRRCRLRDERPSSFGQGPLGQRGLVFTAHQEHREVGTTVTQAPQQLQAIHAWHIEIDDGQRDAVIHDPGEALHRIGERLNCEALMAQEFGQRLQPGRVVINQQDFGSRKHGGNPRTPRA